MGGRALTGFLLVDKPRGPTSHDVVARARRALGLKRIGHAGTLDPPASGLLVLGVGAATRLLSYVQQGDKTYEAAGVLGVRTSTLDAAGSVVSVSDASGVDDRALVGALDAFRGEIVQTPPAVSAVKVAGERAYRRAARGEDVRPEPRSVTVYELELTRFEPPAFGLRMRCSTGTYVRSLVADLGDRLGCGAHVTELRRTAIGGLTVDRAVSPDAIAPDALVAVEDVLPLPVVRVDADVARRGRAGQRLAVPSQDGEVLVAGPDGAIGVFESREGILRPVTVLGT